MVTPAISRSPVPELNARITALFGLSNRMARVTSMHPNNELYLMGRVPKACR